MNHSSEQKNKTINLVLSEYDPIEDDSLISVADLSISQEDSNQLKLAIS